MTAGKGALLTVGHSVHAIEAFVALLRRHEVDAVADVRSVPFSQRNPQFNKGQLAASLSEQGIGYRWPAARAAEVER